MRMRAPYAGQAPQDVSAAAELWSYAKLWPWELVLGHPGSLGYVVSCYSRSGLTRLAGSYASENQTMGNKVVTFTEQELDDYQDCTFFTRKEILRAPAAIVRSILLFGTRRQQKAGSRGKFPHDSPQQTDTQKHKAFHGSAL
ncbi:uncharacterized protein LOC108145514 isoform X2 [Drosophila elegans]|uniref:uncharacterized protein LOC108145514 isoform X2 n=1 Tax=Drosophila elegans TaxID=30023 RepID=UPI001BC85E21|nr:uncharacterized protein LOC108145514 isoform X2 [Drosophila elegans]